MDNPIEHVGIICNRWKVTKDVLVTAGVVAVLLSITSCGSGTPTAVASTATTPAKVAASGPLKAPATSPAQDAAYLTDVSKADAGLASYMQSYGNTALRALLTDGTAFCAFLQRGGGIDAAMSSLAIGANSVESQTHLPASITTYNTIDAVSLLTLCPSEQSLIPPSARATLSQLGKTLGTQSP